jgi:cytochrome b subunit of formate dehydrogenase
MTAGDIAGRTYHVVFILAALALAILILTGCARWDHDPLSVYQMDPKSFEVPVMTFAVFPF